MIRTAQYFLLVFGVGFILGIVRVLWVVPQLGERTAELLEMPLMLAASYVAACSVTRRFKASRRVEYLYSGLGALVLLLIVEFSVVLGLQGMGLREYLVERDPVAGAAYVVVLIIFAVMPWLVGKKHAGA